jgi:hypothetical protein
MGLTHKKIRRVIRPTPPRCLRRFEAKRVRVPAKWARDLVAIWKLVCPCGSGEGTVIGHPLGKLKRGFKANSLFVSPFTFLCGRCGKRTRFLDTDADGAGAELARLDGDDIGCAAYRGTGRGEPFPCPGCGTARGEVVVTLWFNADYMYDLEEDGIEFPFQNLFSWVNVQSRCSACGKQALVTDIDTKY